MKKDEERIQKCFESINALIKAFQASPFKYLLESDVQCDLFQRLRSNVKSSVKVPSSAGESYLLDVIYSEYLDRFDLCCLDGDVIESKDKTYFSPRDGHDEYIYHLPVLLAIELKYIKGKYKQKQNFQKFLDDRKKIENGLSKEDSVSYKKVKNWLCICFIQDEEVLKFQRDKFVDYTFTPVDSIGPRLHKNSDTLLKSQFVISPSKIYEITLKK